MTDTLPVVEIIGPTLQGEGPHMGRRCVLVRLGGCNLTCAGCDTPYSWVDGGQSNPMTIAEISEQILDTIGGLAGYQAGTNRPFDHVIITGGEPLLHQRTEVFQQLVIDFLVSNISVEIETNGTIMPDRWFAPRLLALEGMDAVGVTFVVSPKIVGSLASDPESKRIKAGALTWFRENPASTFKIVCKTGEDVRHVGMWADLNGLRRNRIWIMAEGLAWLSHIIRARDLADVILAEGMNVSTRLHLAMWPTQERGR
jgi:7-carboxy-7-deazaguanine synthase